MNAVFIVGASVGQPQGRTRYPQTTGTAHAKRKSIIHISATGSHRSASYAGSLPVVLEIRLKTPSNAVRTESFVKVSSGCFRDAARTADFPQQALWLFVLHLVPFGARERVSRLGGLSFRHDIGPESPVRPIVEVKELRGPAVVEPYFIAAAVLDGFVLSEVYIDHAPMMPWTCG
jgi:hypothetical protein